MRNLQIVFQGGCTILHSFQQCVNVPTSLPCYQHLLFDLWFVFDYSQASMCEVYLTVFDWLFLSNFYYLFMCLASCIYFVLEKCLFKSLSILKLDYLSFLLWSLRFIYMFYEQVPYCLYDLQTLSPQLDCFFTFLMVFFEEQKFLISMKANVSIPLLWLLLLVSYLRNFCLIQGHGDVLPLSSKHFVFWDLTFRSMTHC